MIDFEVREKDVVVKTEGERFYIPKDILETIYEDAQKEWYYKQDVVDYLKEHYNYALLAEREPEIINELVDLYAGLRKINEGCFNWEECLKQALKTHIHWNSIHWKHLSSLHSISLGIQATTAQMYFQKQF